MPLAENMTYEDYSVEREADIRLAVDAAIEARKHAITFKTSVGACAITRDGALWAGFNMEAYGYKFELHAEEACVIKAMLEGYRTTDFAALVVVFQSAWHEKVDVFPGCPTCWAFLNEFTHRDLMIVVADKEGKVLYRTILGAIYSLPEGMIYPSPAVKLAKPKMGVTPKLG